MSSSQKAKSAGGRRRNLPLLPPLPIPVGGGFKSRPICPFSPYESAPSVIGASVMRGIGSLDYSWLWLGDHAAALDPLFLECADIKRILSVGSEVKLDPTVTRQEICHIDIVDHCDAPLGTHFIRMFKFLYESEMTSSATLVHCRRGISRSATAVIAYLIARDPDHNGKRAFDHVQMCRSQINPNLGFVLILDECEQDLIRTHPNLPWKPKIEPPTKTMCTKCGKEVEGSILEHFEQRHTPLPDWS